MTQLAYFDCLSGISGDMTLGALLDAGVPREPLDAMVASLGIPGCSLQVEDCTKLGIAAKQVNVHFEPEHKHRHLSHILELLEGAEMLDSAKELAEAIFRKLAAAEAKVHGVDIEKVHFHEVGAVDSIVDIFAAALGLKLTGAEQFYASDVPTGNGMVKIAHGRVSVPAPATAELFCQGKIPIRTTTVLGELATPTGAAILATLVPPENFGSVPAMTINAVGYGAGERDLESNPNVMRLVLGSRE